MTKMRRLVKDAKTIRSYGYGSGGVRYPHGGGSIRLLS
jgi:hypothetical protein